MPTHEYRLSEEKVTSLQRLLAFLILSICLALAASCQPAESNSASLPPVDVMSLAYSLDGDIYVQNVPDETESRQITNTNGVVETGPSWSADGRTISFIRDHEEIVVVTFGIGGEIDTQTSIDCSGLCLFAEFSPNGRYLSYVINTSAQSCWGCGYFVIKDMNVGLVIDTSEAEIFGERTGLRYWWTGNIFNYAYYDGIYKTESINLDTGVISSVAYQENFQPLVADSQFRLTSDCAPEDPGPICGDAIVLDPAGNPILHLSGVNSADLYVPELLTVTPEADLKK